MDYASVWAVWHSRSITESLLKVSNHCLCVALSSHPSWTGCQLRQTLILAAVTEIHHHRCISNTFDFEHKHGAAFLRMKGSSSNGSRRPIASEGARKGTRVHRNKTATTPDLFALEHPGFFWVPYLAAMATMALAMSCILRWCGCTLRSRGYCCNRMSVRVSLSSQDVRSGGNNTNLNQGRSWEWPKVSNRVPLQWRRWGERTKAKIIRVKINSATSSATT